MVIFFLAEMDAGFDVEDTSVDGRDDIEGLDASAAHVANLLSSEPSDGTSNNSEFQNAAQFGNNLV